MPKLRLNRPDSIMSTSPEIQASPEAEPASFAGPSRRYDLEPFPDLALERHHSSNRNSSAECEEVSLLQSVRVDPLPLPPTAKVATHHNQLDGTSEELEPSRPLRSLGSCEKLRGSLRKIPAQLIDLFTKDKWSKDEGHGEASEVGLNSSTRGQERATWLSRRTKCFRTYNARKRKSALCKARERSARSSLQYLFSSSAASRVENPFDKPAAQQDFVAPVDEDTNSPTEPDFAEQDEAIERRWIETQPEQTSSDDATVTGHMLDGSADQEDSTQAVHGSGSSSLRKAYSNWRRVFMK